MSDSASVYSAYGSSLNCAKLHSDPAIETMLDKDEKKLLVFPAGCALAVATPADSYISVISLTGGHLNIWIVFLSDVQLRYEPVSHSNAKCLI